MKAVITTIFEPTECIKKLVYKLDNSAAIILIGDSKGPEKFELQGTEFYSLDVQKKLDFKLADKLPEKHYARKNLGYLIAIQQGEDCIYETDDDNSPNSLWKLRTKTVEAVVAENKSWVNVYKHFSEENIWPRGFLLDKINDLDSTPLHNNIIKTFDAPIQQGLANIAPDVDAIWRLTQDKEFYFVDNKSIALQKGAWCPFNTQSTWWWKEAFPLLYLPSYCSFRMTDIWKSFIAQRCLWEMDYNLVFHAAEVDQDRNIHNLMRDFDAEIQGYQFNEKLTCVLEELNLLSGTENALYNLVLCYEALVAENILPKEEINLVKAWAIDIENLLYK